MKGVCFVTIFCAPAFLVLHGFSLPFHLEALTRARTTRPMEYGYLLKYSGGHKSSSGSGSSRRSSIGSALSAKTRRINII